MKKPERISRKISGDLKKLRVVMQNLNENRSALKKFLAKPDKALGDAGIDLKAYGGSVRKSAALAKEISAYVKLQVDSNYWKIFDKIKNKMETTPHESTESGCTKNFDNSSSSSYRYESMTGSEAGQACEKSSSSYTGSSSRFDHSGISIEDFEEIFTGPLISVKAMAYILKNSTRAFQEAQNIK